VIARENLNPITMSPPFPARRHSRCKIFCCRTARVRTSSSTFVA